MFLDALLRGILLKNGDDNIEEMQHQENAIHAQISQRKSKIMENFDKEEKALYEDLTTGKKKVQERVQGQKIKVESIRTEILKYNQELDFVERHARFSISSDNLSMIGSDLMFLDALLRGITLSQVR
jgi:hypothetical protein